jgi:small subunit ribosomal protein S7
MLSFCEASKRFEASIKKKYSTFMLMPHDPALRKCLRLLMKDGKRSKASHLLHQTLKRLDRLDKHPSNFVDTEGVKKGRFRLDQVETYKKRLLSKPNVLSNLSFEASGGSESDPRRETEAHTSLDVFTSKKGALNVFHQAIQHVKPYFELKKVRLSGMTHQVPALLSPSRQETLALQWFIQTARLKHSKHSKHTSAQKTYPFDYYLAKEMTDAVQKQGDVRQKRDDIHKLAESNRGMYRYRWW